jgi:hypothetical protein
VANSQWHHVMRSNVITVTMKIIIFLDVTLYSFIDCYQSSGRPFCSPPSWWKSKVGVKNFQWHKNGRHLLPLIHSQFLSSISMWLTILPWRWKQQVLPKQR